MATRQWLRGGDVILPLGVLGAIVVVDALLPARIVVSGAFVIAAIVASAITTVRRTALIAAAAPSLVTHHLPEGARLLFYTDGLVETRDRDGAFFPLTERAAALRTGSLEDALDGLLAQLADHVEHQITDDVALVLVERQPSHAELGVDHRS